MRPHELMSFAGALLLLSGAGVPQTRKARARAAGDPYTRMEPAALSRAGYASFGPFEWGDRHDSSDIARAMGDIGILWVATDHFRLGSSLADLVVDRGDRGLRRKLEAELRRLKKRLPRLRPRRVRTLDRWLRLHLFAQRLEELYDDFTQRLGEERWRRAANSPIRKGRQPVWSMGNGPFLGMPAKFTVLLFQNPVHLERYQQRFLGRRSTLPRRWVFGATGSALFVTAADAHGGAYRHDSSLHCHVVFNVVHNLIDCHLGDFYRLPVWWTEGAAHWFARRVDPSWASYTQSLDFPDDIKKFTSWHAFTRRVVQHDDATPAAEMLAWLDYEKFTFRDHITAWSRVDFLMQKNASGFGTFMRAIKGQRNPKNGLPIMGSEVLRCQREALRKAWNLDADSLDLAWEKYVLAKYRPEVARR